jgi:hypothetical protein
LVHGTGRDWATRVRDVPDQHDRVLLHRETGSRALAFSLGIAVGLVLTVPQIRPFGIPVAYAMLVAVLLWSSLHGLRVPPPVPPLIAVWAVPVAYAVAHDVSVAAGETLQLFVRNAVALGAAWLLVVTMRDYRRGMATLAGLGLVMLVDSGVGIGQALGAEWAVLAALPFASEEINAEVLGGQSVTRSWGIHAYRHMYAYTVSLWVFATFAWLACAPSTRSRLKPLVVLSLLVGVVALVLSGQRSAVGSVLASMVVVVLVMVRSNPRALAALLTLGLLAVAAGLALFADEAPAALQRLLSGVDVASDAERAASWIEGWRVLEEDPYLGMAFGSYGGRIGIHNAFLGGWARYGLPWLAVVALAVVLTCWYFLVASKASLPARVAALMFVGIMLANAMFHTSAPTLNDMPFLILLGTMLALVSWYDELRRERRRGD